MVTRIDLRVHTTAPSSKKDDEKFKAQADAYDAFVAANTFIRVHQNGSPRVKADAPSSPQPDMIPSEIVPDPEEVSEKRLGDLTDIPYDPTTFLEETQLGYTALESQLFVAPSRVSPRTLKHPLQPSETIINELMNDKDEHTEASRSREEASSSSSSHQVPSQSSYLKSPILDRSNKKPRINEENRQYFRPKGSLLPSLMQSRGNSSEAVKSVKNAAENKIVRPAENEQHLSTPLENSMSGDDATSELPTSYSLSDMTSVSSKGRQNSIQRSLSDSGPPLPEVTEPVLASQEHMSVQSIGPPPNKPAVATLEIAPTTPALVVASNSDIVVKDFADIEHNQKEADVSTQQILSHSDLPTSIRPPGPTASLQPLKTHLTKSLKHLSENVNLAQCYKPVSVSRDLIQSERGCWTFDITTWPSQLRTDFFQFLTKMIEPGRVGWGVWCVREPASLEVRVFCWGEVVRHIYLMLYVASKSKVRKLGLKWVDADGVVAVQMRGADDNSRKELT